jgi:hypothetical protein
MDLNPTVYGVASVPAIIGLVEAAKRLGLPSTWAPALAVVLGILAGAAVLAGPGQPWIQPVVQGIALGLSAAGLYAGTSTVVTARKKAQLKKQLAARLATATSVPVNDGPIVTKGTVHAQGKTPDVAPTRTRPSRPRKPTAQSSQPKAPSDATDRG